MNEILTNANAYEPTPAEFKIIEVIVNPDNLGKNITDICKLADISRTTYYEIIKKPEFHDYKNKIIIDTLKAKIGDIINASIKFGTSSAKNSADRKMLLQMTGLYTDKQEITSTNNNVNQNITISDEEAKKFLDEMAKKLDVES